MTEPPSLPPRLAQAFAPDGEPNAQVAAILSAIEDRDAGVVEFLKARAATETHPHVLATIASAIGKLGRPEDAGALIELFHHEDTRVVANALEAAGRLEVEVDFISLSVVMDHDDPRITANAIALLAASEPDLVCQVIESRYAISTPQQRCSLAHVLAAHGQEPSRSTTMLEFLERETQPLVIQSLLDSLTKITPCPAPAEVTERVGAIRDGSSENKALLIDRWSEAAGGRPDE